MFGCFISMIFSYLLGSVSAALIAGRLAGMDIRQQGSGNAGATNTLRVLGWKASLAVLAFDVLKGAAAVLWFPGLGRAAAPMPGGDPATVLAIQSAPALAAAAVLAGQAFPLFAKFRGGKGVAVAAGALAALAPQVVPTSLLVFLLTVFLSGYVSLGSLLAAAQLLPAYLLLTPVLRGGAVELPTALFCGLASILVMVLHRRNIGRLLRGEEARFEKFRILRRRRAGNAKNSKKAGEQPDLD